jgi:hypothetical protein
MARSNEELTQMVNQMRIDAQSSDKTAKNMITQMTESNLGILQAMQAATTAARPQGRPNSKLRVFSSGDAEEWLIFRRHVEMVAQINSWDRDRSCQELQNALDGAAARRVEQIDLSTATLKESLDVYETRFVHAADSQLARTAFNSCCQKENEGMLDWHGRCRALHVRAWRLRNDRETAEDLIHRFSHGIHNPAIFCKVTEKNPTTYAEALVAGQNAEAVAHSLRARQDSKRGNYSISAMSSMQMGAMEPPSTSVAATAVRTKRSWPDPRKRSGPTSSADKECWHCGIAGHLRAECRKYAAEKNGVSRIATARPASRSQRGASRRGSRSSWRGGAFRRSPRQLATLGGEYEDDWEVEETERRAAGN